MVLFDVKESRAKVEVGKGDEKVQFEQERICVLLVVESGNGTVQGVSDSPSYVLAHRSPHKDKGSRSEIKVLFHPSPFLHGYEQRDSGLKQGVEFDDPLEQGHGCDSFPVSGIQL
jgi:hypothetical protein